MSAAESGPPRCPAPAWWMACTISLRASTLVRRRSSREGRVSTAVMDGSPRLRQCRDHCAIDLCGQSRDVGRGGRKEEGSEAAELDRLAVAAERNLLAGLGGDLLLADAKRLGPTRVERADAVSVETTGRERVHPDVRRQLPRQRLG